MTALWNEDVDGPAIETDEVAVTGLLSVGRGGQILSLQFDPPFPDVAAMRPGTVASGRVIARADGRAQFGGRWSACRGNESADIDLAVDQPWDPGPQPLPTRAVFLLLPVFRTWPTTYRWQASVDLSQHPPTIRGGWTRTA
jgi:hypothetical protein